MSTRYNITGTIKCYKLEGVDEGHDDDEPVEAQQQDAQREAPVAAAPLPVKEAVRAAICLLVLENCECVLGALRGLCENCARPVAPRSKSGTVTLPVTLQVCGLSYADHSKTESWSGAASRRLSLPTHAAPLFAE